MNQPPNPPEVWHFVDGYWQRIPDPIDWHDGDSVLERYAEAGYCAKDHKPALAVYGRVFTKEDGTPLRPGGPRQPRRDGLPPIRFHDLRRGTATMLLAAGQPPKVISEVLGHATVAFTMDVYTEVAEELADAAMEALAAYIPRRNRLPAGE